MSLAVFLQQFGRSLRIMPGKTRGLVIDCVSNVKIHGLPDKPRFWSLDRREKRRKKENDPEDVPVKICRNVPACGRAYDGLLRVCPYCGVAPVPVGSGRSIEQVDGDLMLLDAAILDQMRKSIILEAPGDIGARLAASYVKSAGVIGQTNRQIEKVESQRRLWNSIAQWAGYQRARGFDDAQIQRKFYAGMKLDVVSVLGQSRVDMDKANDILIGWIADEAA